MRKQLYRLKRCDTNLKTTFGDPSGFKSGFFSGTAGIVKLLRGTQDGGVRAAMANLVPDDKADVAEMVSDLSVMGANEGG